MAIRCYSRHVRRPMSASNTGSSTAAGANGSANSASSTQTGNTTAASPRSAARQSTAHGFSSGFNLVLWLGVMLACVMLPACSATPSTQRFAFAVRDSETAMPVANAHAIVTINQGPFWFEGQPIHLTTDNVGMDHALLVLNMASYKVSVTRDGYKDVCFVLPVFNNRFPFGQWLEAVECKHSHLEPCTGECKVSKLELMVTEPMP